MTLLKQLSIRTKCYALLCVKDRKGERTNWRREREEEALEIELRREKNSVVAKIRTFSQTNDRNVI